jgi:hypothetical protein
LLGAFYFPRGTVNYTGGSTSQNPCFQILAWSLKFAGHTNVGNNCPTGFGQIGTNKIRLVA